MAERKLAKLMLITAGWVAIGYFDMAYVQIGIVSAWKAAFFEVLYIVSGLVWLMF